MRGPLLAGVLLVSLLAGCTDDQKDAAATPDHGVAGAATAEVPQWQVGDWWTYRFDDGSTATWVVTQDAGDDWIMDIDDPDFAFFHGALEEVSTLGRQSKEDLAGSQGSDRVLFVDFPLEAGKIWTTTWDAVRFDAEAHELGDGRWHIQYSRDSQVLRNIVYDEAARWFRSTEAVDANGTTLWKATLQQSGSDYGGTYVRWDLHADVHVQVGVGALSESSFMVPEGATDIWYALRLFCSPEGIEGDQGPYGYQVRPSDELQGELAEIGLCPHDVDEQGTLTATPGSWTLEVFSGGATIDLRVIPRTLQELRL